MAGKKKAPPYYLYIIECEDGSLYTGIALDPRRRFEAHKSGRGAAYTRMRKPLRLVKALIAGTLGEALKKEAALKRKSRAAKRAWAGMPVESFDP